MTYSSGEVDYHGELPAKFYFKLLYFPQIEDDIELLHMFLRRDIHA